MVASAYLGSGKKDAGDLGETHVHGNGRKGMDIPGARDSLLLWCPGGGPPAEKITRTKKGRPFGRPFASCEAILLGDSFSLALSQFDLDQLARLTATEVASERQLVHHALHLL